VGEGEPTLYLELKKLIVEIKKLVNKPVAVITNGALLYDENVKDALMNADIVLPSMDAYNEKTYRTINRPIGKLEFSKIYQGLVDFSMVYKGQLWIEIMLIDGINDDSDSINQFERLLQAINYDRLFINTPVRPPAEKWTKASSSEKIKRACTQLGGISIENLVSKGFSSDIADDYQAVLSIIGRHPMNQHEIISFLIARGCKDTKKMIVRLEEDPKISSINYKGYITYRIKEY
jgi:wyosine [tRNA(Phe)-imidazoG37] synthetase (radical SAM superfamily)